MQSSSSSSSGRGGRGGRGSRGGGRGSRGGGNRRGGGGYRSDAHAGYYNDNQHGSKKRKRASSESGSTAKKDTTAMRLHPNAQTLRYVVQKNNPGEKISFHPNGPRANLPSDQMRAYTLGVTSLHAHRVQGFKAGGLELNCAGCYQWQTPDQRNSKPETMVWCPRCHEVAYCSQGCRFRDWEFGQHRFLCRTADVFNTDGQYSHSGACGFQNYAVKLPDFKNLPELDRR